MKIKNCPVNKVAIVTGGARGIGKNISSRLSSNGILTVICDIDSKAGFRMSSGLRKANFPVEFLKVDLSKSGCPQNMIKEVIKRYGRLDILVNNVSSRSSLKLMDINEKIWDKEISLSLKSAFFASQEAIRQIAKNGEGSIVNISSIAASLVCHQSPVYHIAKAGMIQMTRYLAVAAAKEGVRVNTIMPGFIIQDEHLKRYERKDNREYRRIVEFCHPAGKAGSSDDVANMVMFLCSPEASFISGVCITIDGGLSLQEQSTLLYRFAREKHK